MPAFCHFWHMTPSEFRRLTTREYRLMQTYQREYQRKEDERIRNLTGG